VNFDMLTLGSQKALPSTRQMENRQRKRVLDFKDTIRTTISAPDDREEPQMPVSTWDPFQDPWALQERVERRIRKGWRSARARKICKPDSGRRRSTSSRMRRRSPPYRPPGRRPDDLELRVEDATLILRGKRNPPGGMRRENMHRTERPQGTFVRTFRLPSNVDQTAIRASQRTGSWKSPCQKAGIESQGDTDRSKMTRRPPAVGATGGIGRVMASAPAAG